MNSEILYKKAYEEHYKRKNYIKAKEIYQNIIDNCAKSKEAQYARDQIGNIDKMTDLEKNKFDEWQDSSPNIILTNAPFIQGYEIKETIQIISAEYVFGLNVLEDFLTSLTDFLGSRSETSQNAFKKAREVCLTELRKEARLIGANAVIAVSLNYNEFSGSGKSMLFTIATGTAVIVSKLNKDKTDTMEIPVETV